MCLMIPYAQALDSDLYCQQLDRLKEAIAQKLSALSNRTENVFHQQQVRHLYSGTPEATAACLRGSYALTPNDC